MRHDKVVNTDHAYVEGRKAAVGEGYCPNCRGRLAAFTERQHSLLTVTMLAQNRTVPRNGGYCAPCAMHYLVFHEGLMSVKDEYVARLGSS